MSIITRFSPTVSGALHIGHLYSMLVNERFAHEQGGEFCIRFDDTSPTALVTLDRMPRILEKQYRDIRWLEIDVDEWQKQSELLSEARRRLEELSFKPFVESVPYTHSLFIGMGLDFLSYPYTPQQTAERVVMDNMLGITHVIRGEEFSTECSLYCHYCEMFGFSTPEFAFLPRLTGSRGDISKTNGGYTIAEFRNNGYSAQDLKDAIVEACLFRPGNKWSFYNLKPNPQFNI